MAPKDLDTIKGKEVIQVCIGSYQVILNFTQSLTLTIEGGYSLENKNFAELRFAGDMPDRTKELVCLLGASIVRAARLLDECVIIDFSNGYKLKLFSEPTGMESFSIRSSDFEVAG